MSRPPILRNEIVSLLKAKPMTVPMLAQATGRSRSAVNTTVVRMEEMRMVNRRRGERTGRGTFPYLFALTEQAA